MTATANCNSSSSARPYGLLGHSERSPAVNADVSPAFLVPTGVEAILRNSSSLAPHQAAQLRDHIAMLTRSVHELGQISRDAMVQRSNMRQELKAAISDRDRWAARCNSISILRRRRAAQ
ncbi:MAG: hypothetical protein ACRER5_16320 [Pseudomonas sp.]